MPLFAPDKTLWQPRRRVFVPSYVAQGFTVTNLYNYDAPSGAGNEVTSKTSTSLSIPDESIVVVYVGGSCFNVANYEWLATYDLTCTDSVDGATGWNAIAASYAGEFGNNFYRPGGMAFWKYFPDAVSRTITVARDGTKKWVPGIDIVAVQGANTSSPVVQSEGNHTMSIGNDVSLTVTLPDAPIQGNCVLWFCCANNDNPGASAVPSGYTPLAAPTATCEATAASYNTNTTTAAVTSTDIGENISSAVAAAVEIAVA